MRISMSKLGLGMSFMNIGDKKYDVSFELSRKFYKCQRQCMGLEAVGDFSMSKKSYPTFRF